MKKTKTVMVKQEVIEDIICNMCGNSCYDEAGENIEGLIECCFRGGFYSKLGDLVVYQFSLCEGCLEELFKKFKIDPHYIKDDNVEM